MSCGWCETGQSPSQCGDSPVADKLATDQSQEALEGVGRASLRFSSQESDADKSASECVYAANWPKSNR